MRETIAEEARRIYNPKHERNEHLATVLALITSFAIAFGIVALGLWLSQ